MRLLTFEEAGAVYGKTARTIQRWVASGRLKTGTSDGRLMVEVGDDVETDPRVKAADMTDNLSKLASAHAIQRSRDADILLHMVSDVRSTRRWCRATSGILAALLIGLAGISHVREIRHVGQVADAEARHVAEVVQLQARASALRDERDRLALVAARIQAQRDSALWVAGLPVPDSPPVQVAEKRP